MHKIKKGIKKKIKGKKDKNQEIFTEEEYELYKKQKEDAKRQEEEDPISEEPYPSYTEESKTAAPTASEAARTEYKDSESDEDCENKEDWRNYLSSADVVLKKTSENLEHIKEASYFQTNQPKQEANSEIHNHIRSVTPSELTKNWANLEEGGFSDEEDVKVQVEIPAEPKKALHERVRNFKEIAPIQNIPSVDTEDYAGIFDTTYVDQIESGEIKLHIIPQSPTEYDPSEPDPFDTSGIEKILQKSKPKGKKKDKKDSKKKIVKEIKPIEPVAPVIKKKIVVNLGSAVHALTSDTQPETASPKVNSSRSSRIVPEINLLGGENTDEHQEQTNENIENKQGEQEFEKSSIDDALSSNLNTEDLIDSECTPNEELLNQLENNECPNKTDIKTETDKDNSLKNIVDEFDVISKEIVPDANSNLELITQSSEKNKELDDEFALLAEESLTKNNETTLNPIEDDPFDTSVAEKFIEKVPSSEETTVTSESNKEVKSDIFSTDNVESDPFDTSNVNDIVPVDPFDTLADKDLPEALIPQCQTSDKKDDSFDPFDTSAIVGFGKTELKFLEEELLNNIDKKDKEEDFDFNPREEEDQSRKNPSRDPDFFLSTNEESLAESVLSPQAFSIPKEDIDPFDTTIADKIQIKDLEKELLENDNNTYISPSKLNASDYFTSNKLVLAVEPSLTADINSDIDPFDTSVADSICEKVRLETEEKFNQEKTCLALKLKPPRPPSPACLLTTTPLDENPTLLPIAKNLNTPTEIELESEADPFDTSIAAQFGKTELQVLENELLTKNTLDIEEDFSNFDPREEEKIVSSPITEQTTPVCLLTSEEQVEQPLPLLAPAKLTYSEDNIELDPFDTSVADKLGTSELNYFESTSETAGNTATNFKLPLSNKATPPRPSPPAKLAACIFAVTPTDSNPPLQPNPEITETKKADTPKDIDPFDTSIADQFGKTELKALEEILFTCNSNEQSIPPSQVKEKDFLTNTEQVHNILSQPTTLDCQPVLQPTSNIDNKEYIDEVDPFDTSIADNFGNTELRSLEIELLADAGIKRNLSDEELFDPREEEKKSPRIVR